MPMEHLRKNADGKVGLYQGYFCLTCGKSAAMISPQHGPNVCESNQELVEELVELNKKQ